MKLQKLTKFFQKNYHRLTQRAVPVCDMFDNAVNAKWASAIAQISKNPFGDFNTDVHQLDFNFTEAC
jgi:hypothetical protein